MHGQVAVVREQGQTFSVLLVKDSAVQPGQRESTLAGAQEMFGARTAILGERGHRLYGPDDIVRFLSNVDPGRLPWRRFDA